MSLSQRTKTRPCPAGWTDLCQLPALGLLQWVTLGIRTLGCGEGLAACVLSSSSLDKAEVMSPVTTHVSVTSLESGLTQKVEKLVGPHPFSCAEGKLREDSRASFPLPNINKPFPAFPAMASHQQSPLPYQKRQRLVSSCDTEVSRGVGHAPAPTLQARGVWIGNPLETTSSCDVAEV